MFKRVENENVSICSDKMSSQLLHRYENTYYVSTLLCHMYQIHIPKITNLREDREKEIYLSHQKLLSTATIFTSENGIEFSAL
jgi:hypothetical protein